MDYYRSQFENTGHMHNVPFQLIVEDSGAWFPGVFYNERFHNFIKTGDWSINWSHNYLIGQQIGIGPIGMTVSSINAYRSGVLWVW
jgi:hypothetical protein